MEKQLNNFIQELSKAKKMSVGKLSDGHHSFQELYEHRNLLFITIARMLHDEGNWTWKSVKDKHGKDLKGWFILGVDYIYPDLAELLQITYHLPMSVWKYCKFANTVNKSQWNGHTSQDVIKQLKQMLNHD